jgi:hypothetical protein
LAIEWSLYKIAHQAPAIKAKRLAVQHANVSPWLATLSGGPALSLYSQTNFCLNHNRRLKVLHKKTLIALAAAVALGCVPMATNASAAGHQNEGRGGGGQGGGGQAFAGHGGGGHAMAGPARGGNGSAGYARGGRVVVRSGGGGYYGGGGGYYDGGGPVYYNGPIYDSCSGYGYGGCPGYGVPLVGAVINGILGGPGY